MSCITTCPESRHVLNHDMHTAPHDTRRGPRRLTPAAVKGEPQARERCVHCDPGKIGRRAAPKPALSERGVITVVEPGAKCFPTDPQAHDLNVRPGRRCEARLAAGAGPFRRAGRVRPRDHRCSEPRCPGIAATFGTKPRSGSSRRAGVHSFGSRGGAGRIEGRRRRDARRPRLPSSGTQGIDPPRPGDRVARGSPDPRRISGDRSAVSESHRDRRPRRSIASLVRHDGATCSGWTRPVRRPHRRARPHRYQIRPRRDSRGNLQDALRR